MYTAPNCPTMLRLAKTFELLTGVLDRLAISYAVVGSVASSARGSYRATEDIDVLAQISAGQAVELAQALGQDWYADAGRFAMQLPQGEPYKPVVDETGLPGLFAISLDFGPLKLSASPKVEVAPPLQTALEQQLGLKLEAGKRARADNRQRGEDADGKLIGHSGTLIEEVDRGVVRAEFLRLVLGIAAALGSFATLGGNPLDAGHRFQDALALMVGRLQ